MLGKLITVLRLISEIPLSIIYWLSYLVPKNDHLWIFGSYHNQYIDNSRYLFEYVNKYKNNIIPIWLSNNGSIVKSLTNRGYSSYKSFSLMGFYYSARARVVVISAYRSDVNPYSIGRAKVVNLWHGHPLKKIEWEIPVGYNNHFYWRRRLFSLISFIFPKFNYRYHLITAPSRETAKIYSKTFKINLNDIVVTGDPRTDRIFSSQLSVRNNKNLLYMPTFRSKGKIDYFKYDFYPEEWEITLSNNNINFVAKFHVNEKLNVENYINITSCYSKFQLLDYKVDLYKILRDTDILITDYSSIMFDYSLLNRPILFLPIDLNEYILEERPMYYDYKTEITSGRSFSNWEELRLYIEDVGIDNIKPTGFLSSFHEFHDGQSSKRVYNTVCEKFSIRQS